MTTITGVRVPRVGPAPRLRRTARIALVLLLMAFLLGTLGVTYEVMMASGDARRYPPPGRLIDVGGHRLHIHCLGAGGPTVVLESGNGGMTLDWEPVMAKLVPTTRVCAYDRAGTGWSDRGPLPRTPERVADELHALLTRAGEAGPYLLVGHSLGGHYVDQFARKYPAQVVGLVLLDARNAFYEQALSETERRALPRQQAQVDTLFLALRRLGVLRLVDRHILTWLVPGFRHLPPEQRAARTILQSAASRATTSRHELDALAEGGAALEPPPTSIHPLRVLVSAAAGVDPIFLAAQRQRAQHGANSSVHIVDGSGHYLQLDAPDVVAGAIQEVSAVPFQSK